MSIATMREIEFRDAVREAMSEEMRRDMRVMLMGEEVAQYNGAYKVSRGMLDEFGPRRVCRGLSVWLRLIQFSITLPRCSICLVDNSVVQSFFAATMARVDNLVRRIRGASKVSSRMSPA